MESNLKSFFDLAPNNPFAKKKETAPKLKTMSRQDKLSFLSHKSAKKLSATMDSQTQSKNAN